MAEAYHLGNWGGAIASSNKDRSVRLGMITLEGSRTRESVERQFNSLELPTFQQKIMALKTFLANPYEVLDNLRTPTLWCQLMSSDGTGKRQTTLDITPARLVSSAHEAETSGTWNTILVSEYVENKFGGNIVVSRDNVVTIELGEGAHINYARGLKTPTHFADNHTPSERMRYSFDEPCLREATWRALQTIPHDTNDVRPLYLPGYYEFALVGEELQPIFFDFRPSNVYQLPQ